MDSREPYIFKTTDYGADVEAASTAICPRSIR